MHLLVASARYGALPVPAYRVASHVACRSACREACRGVRLQAACARCRAPQGQAAQRLAP